MMWKIFSYAFSLVVLGGVVIIPSILPAYAAEGDIDCSNGGNGFGCTQHVTDVKVYGTEKWPSSQLLDTIKKTINWLLGLLATIALVLCLYAGFLVVTAAGNDANQKKGMTILKQAAMWIAIIGLSWLFVSLVFRIIAVMTKTS
jgi:hypothetical protein